MKEISLVQSMQEADLITETKQPQKRPNKAQIGVWAVLGGLMLVILLLLARPALAAIELSYFYVISNPASVILQWGTRSEFNIHGFEILCKRADEPDIAYHRIHFAPAKGSPSTPAQYSFAVTTGMQPGVPYCFRLLEVTTDGAPGEAHDRCGYGPNVTPTPGAPGIIPTADPNAQAADMFGSPLSQPQFDAFGNPIPQQQFDAFGNPIPQQPDPFASPLSAPQQFDEFGNPIPQFDQFGNPINPAPQQFDQFGNPIPQFDQFGNPINPTPQQFDQFGNPIPQFDQFGNPINPAPQQFDQFGNPIPQSPLATPTPTIDPSAPPTPIVLTPIQGDPRSSASAFDALEDPSLAQAGADVPMPFEEPIAAAPAYIIVTAAPTEPPVALAAAMTPLPTVTPTPPVFQLVNALAPTTQNLMIMLLCLTFTGAGGIGILGLITSVMFMRARSSQRDFYDRHHLPPPRRRQW